MSEDIIVYHSGKLIPSEQLLRATQFTIVLPLVENSRSKLRDIVAYLFFMRSPRSIFVNLPDEDKYRQICNSGRINDIKWLDRIREDERIEDLLLHYGRLAMTPGERMRLDLIETIHRFLQEVSSVEVGDSNTMVKKVDESNKLFDALEKLEKMILKESKQKVKKGYKPHRFERRPEIQQSPTLPT